MGPVSVLSNIGVKAGEADLAWLVILYDIYCLMLLAPDPGVVGQLLFFRNRFALSIWLARRLNSGTNHHRHRREP